VTASGPGGEPPDGLARIPQARRVTLDVRENIRRGEEPLAHIMAVVGDLACDQALVVRAPFEPVPLYRVLGARGFHHWTERRSPDDWCVSFYRDVEPGASTGGRVLDVRGLEPPEPMVRILDEVERLGPGALLEVRHERRPTFLYPQLDERGFAHETDEPEPGLVRILIRRREL